jgi:DNA repair protein RecO (recombination protein O)
MPRIQQQPAYVLHGRAYRESSLLLELLSRDHGRTALVARGARGPKSRWRNLLQPFRPLLVGWTARGELGTLAAAEQIAAPPALHGEALYCGLYLNELLMRLLHRGDPHPEVFERYRGTLAELASHRAPQPVLRVFEKHLLDAVGYGLVLDHDCSNGEAISDEAWYDYRPDRGPARVSGQSGELGQLVSGAALRALREECFDPEALHQLRGMMRRVLRYHLGEKPLRSAALFR